MKLTCLDGAVGAILLCEQTATSQSAFTRISTGPIATEGKYSNRCVWVDYDNDGDLDLWVANGTWGLGLPPKANYLYRNDGSGGFTKIATGVLVEDLEQSATGAWGDYDNDGHLDLFVNNLGDGDQSLFRNSLYRSLGDGTFTRVTNTPLDKDGGSHSGGYWADYDNDGHLDLLVVNWNGPGSLDSNLLYHNHGDATFTRLTAGPLVTNVTAAQGAAWAGYDGDGDLDLFVANAEFFPNVPRQNSLYRNEGGGMFTPITTGHPVAEESLDVSGAWGDYDNDGDLDLYVCYAWNERGNSLFQNNGDGTFGKITDSVVLSTLGAFAAAWGDYDNDGFLDLFLAGGTLGNRLYHNSGNGTFTRIATGPGADQGNVSFGCDWGDYDNDGFLDLFVANATLFENRAAIGAQVRVLASLGGANLWQMREISVGGTSSGHNLLAHFGLRDALKADLVRIEWPSGIVQELREVPARQTLTVTEPPRLYATGPGRFRIGCWRGQMFQVQASADLMSWSPIATITNLSGTVEFADPDAKPSAQRFYRAAQP